MNTLDTMPDVPRDANGPVFTQPWQAQAFAIVFWLHQQGRFTWREWATALAGEIAEHGDSDDYYGHWLGALEEIVLAKGLATARELAEMHAAWAQVAASTPHGTPLALPPINTP